MKLTPEKVVHRLQAAFDLALNEGLHPNKVDPTRISRLRVSSFPFCGLKWFLGLQSISNKKSFMSSAMRYFVTVGSSLHSVMQDALLTVDLEPLSIEVYADWKCAKCNHVHRFCGRPTACVKCKEMKLSYEEITVDSKPVMGHIDTVFLVSLKVPTEDFPSGKVFVVVDYKTTSTKKIESGALPYSDNKEQIRAYVNELHRKRKPVAPFAFLVYVPRDNPWKYKILVVMVNLEQEEKKRARYVSRFQIALKVETEDQVSSLVARRPCREKQKKLYASCPHFAYCPGSDNHDMILNKAQDLRSKLELKLPMSKYLKPFL